jgi:uncharacterized protein
MGRKRLGFEFMRLPTVAPGAPESETDMTTPNGMVDAVLERGFSYFYTTYRYHAGKSEAAIREALVKRHPRASFSLATKLPIMFLKA